jgi:hypothetical protein
MSQQLVAYPEIATAHDAWRRAVAKYNAAIQASIDADRGKPHNPYVDPNDAQHAPITEAGKECSRTYKELCDLREAAGMTREPV